MTTGIVTRRADLSDLDVLLADVAAGLATYTTFMPAGWRPRDISQDRDREAELLADSDTWALLALIDGAPAGHSQVVAARERRAGEARVTWQARSLIPGLAQLRQLFVLPEWSGRGVAPLLHDAAVAEMRARGCRSGRLFTPSEHARARRFYERRGWVAAAEEWNEEQRLRLTEYRLVLDHPAPASHPAR